jgi:UPF0755 protein
MFTFSKKFFIGIFSFLFLSACLGGFLAYKARLAKNVAKQNQKAPEISLTIIEGWDTAEVASYLEKKNIAKKDIFLQIVKKFDTKGYPLLASKTQNSNLEGFLFPDTYRIFDPQKQKFSNYNPSLDLIEKMLLNFSQKFTIEMQEQAKKNGMTVYKTLILASIIEKETGRNTLTESQKINLDRERKIVAGIFYNRLKNNLALESDATINYITKKNTPSASALDLKINSPFNTYQNTGLPPTPICNPGLSSILAALYPENTEYFFFLHKQPSGEVVFSKTFDEHIKNKLKYLK